MPAVVSYHTESEYIQNNSLIGKQNPITINGMDPVDEKVLFSPVRKFVINSPDRKVNFVGENPYYDRYKELFYTTDKQLLDPNADYYGYYFAISPNFFVWWWV